MVSLCPLASGASALDASEALQFRHDDPLESRLWVSALIAVGLAVLAGASFVYSRRREKVESDGMPRSRLLKVVMLKRVHSKLHIVSVELNGRTQVVFADNGHALLELGRSELDSPGVIKAE
jgi:LPXTG-motif cell wall-anchored protein